MISSETGRPRTLVPAEENQRIARALIEWLNECPYKPVEKVDFEYLPKDDEGLMVSTIQAAYKLRQYILGGYQAQYQFKIVYRTQPGTRSERLECDEALEQIGAWAEENKAGLKIGDSARVVSIRMDSNSSLFAAYDDGSRDHQILMNLIYEVL